MGRRRNPLPAPAPARTSTGLLTTAEVATLLNVHPKHVYRLLRRGLPARRIGGDWRYDRDEVLRWGAPTQATSTPSTDVVHPVAAALLAANGDVLVEILLEMVNERAPLVGFVKSDRDRALELLGTGEVMLAGSH